MKDQKSGIEIYGHWKIIVPLVAVPAFKIVREKPKHNAENPKKIVVSH